MKRRSLVIVAVFALGLGLSSCGSYGTNDKQQTYNNTTQVDSDGFRFFKIVHEKGSQAIEFANYANEHGVESAGKSLNTKILEVFPALLTEMEAVATKTHVILPDPGRLAFEPNAKLAVDSTRSFNSIEYLTYAQNELGLILKQFERASRNTDPLVRAFAGEKLEQIKELYVLAGGTIDEHAHH